MSSFYNLHSNKYAPESRKIKPINLLNHIDGQIGIERHKKENKQKKNHHPSFEIKAHFKKITHLTELVNTELSNRKSNYRFCIYQNKSEINIDVLILENQRKTKKIFQQNITHDKFTKWVENILDGEGFIIDSKV